jgi:predicted nucleotidyltransferase component of viral defense system
MNSQALSDKAKHLAKKYNVTSNLIINHYFFDSFLKRLAKSDYRNHLVLKGGYLLSIELGIMTRTTNDLDFLLQNENLSEKFILDMINEIILIDIEDLIEYNIIVIEPIKDGNGLRIKLQAKLERIRQPINIDVAVSDPITPKVVQNLYTTIMDSEKVNINVYPYETILAEKLQTVVSLGITSSRAKDLYDLFIISKIFFDKMNIGDTKKAIQNTFNYRKTSYEYNSIMVELKDVRNNQIQKQLWNRYVNNHFFANGIPFTDMMDSITIMIKKIYDHK